uniref:Uncharacterized protein n=1 Tax=Anguilla anguilla TaxID=7936 RepID=A0A0E9P827_ANGAN
MSFETLGRIFHILRQFHN